MRWKRLGTVIVLVVAAIVMISIGARVPQQRPDADQLDTESDGPALSAKRAQPVVDEQGRRVLLVGEVELRIPESENPISTATASAENRLVQVSLCWPKDPMTGDCPGIENVAMIFIQGGKKTDPTIDHGMAKLRQELPMQDGPFDSNMVGIWEFLVPDAKIVSFYALIEPSSFGRHVVARCYGGSRCSAWIFVVPGLSAKYDFDRKLLPEWPQLDMEIRKYIHSFIVEE